MQACLPPRKTDAAVSIDGHSHIVFLLIPSFSFFQKKQIRESTSVVSVRNHAASNERRPIDSETLTIGMSTIGVYIINGPVPMRKVRYSDKKRLPIGLTLTHRNT